MPLHPDYQPLIEQMAQGDAPPLHEMSPEAAREMYRAMQPARPDLAVGAVADRAVPGPGGEIPVRIYTPAGDGPHPLLMVYHGGGWVIGDLDTCDATCRQLCEGARAVVVSVDYRLAPEHRFPAAVDDCLAATRWAVDNAADLQADAARLAVSGDSAGGNLAAVMAQLCRDAGPAIAFQLLIYPVTDADMATDSYTTHAASGLLSADGMVWFWDHYAPENPQRNDPRASPAKAADLAGLPPAMVITAEYDPLCDEGEAYGRALQAAGVPVVMRRWDGMPHGFFAMASLLPCGQPAVDEACAALRQALGTA